MRLLSLKAHYCAPPEAVVETFRERSRTWIFRVITEGYKAIGEHAPADWRRRRRMHIVAAPGKR